MTDGLALFSNSITWCLITIVIYQVFALCQKLSGKIWLNPMLLSILILVPVLVISNTSFNHYFSATYPLTKLLEPAVVALGFPLYQHFNTVKGKWKIISSLLILAAILAITVSFIITSIVIAIPEIAVSLSLKSITTPIAIAITEQYGGNISVTALSIIIAGLLGATIGVRWLEFIGVKSPYAQGLAIGTASHALGTSTISQISYQHAAYGSLALIMSATVTALISPLLFPLLFAIAL